MRIKIKEQHIEKVNELKDKMLEAQTGFEQATTNLHKAKTDLWSMISTLYKIESSPDVKLHFNTMEIEFPDPDIHPALKK